MYIEHIWVFGAIMLLNIKENTKMKGHIFQISVSVSPLIRSIDFNANVTDNSTDSEDMKSNSTVLPPFITTPTTDFSYLDRCPYDASCDSLGAECITCKFNYYCVYGNIETAVCTVKQNITCSVRILTSVFTISLE